MKKTMRHAAVGILTAAILCAPLAANAATYQGVDIAHYDDVRDFNAIKASGHGQFVYIKASEGTGYRDPKRQTFTAGAQSAGIPFGYYHYFHSGTDAYGAAQADVFWNLIKDTGYTIIPAVDIEETDGNDAPVIQSSLRAFVDRFYALSGRKPMIYSYTSFFKEFIGSGFTDCPLWQAHVGVQSPTSIPGWGSDHTIWQYSWTGPVSGIYNNTDLDVADDRIFWNTQAIPNTTQPTTTSDYYEVSSLPQAANSRAGTDFYIRDRYGNRIGNHQIDAGDPLIILGVDYTTQLAEVLYPNYSAGGWFHGYIRNIPSLLHNVGYRQWQNGSTNEPVYDKTGNRIGTIYPHEKATVLDRGGMTKVLYSTGKGSETKSGFVHYLGK